MALTDPLAERAARIEAFDGPAEKVSVALSRVTHRPPISTALSGTCLGHPLHPVLTDVPIGCWTSAFVLDFLGGRSARPAAQLLIGTGVLGALPTALTGLADWADTGGEQRRVGVAHALINTSALGCYALSWAARRKGHHARGLFLSLVGATAATVAASLGGHLVYRIGTGVDVNAFDTGPEDWTAPNSSEPVDGVDGVVLRTGAERVLATRKNGSAWRGIGARCSHRDGPLDEGTFEEDCVTCPWHHSRFRLEDGSIVDGPATAPQPRYDVSDHGGQLLVKARREAAH